MNESIARLQEVPKIVTPKGVGGKSFKVNQALLKTYKVCVEFIHLIDRWLKKWPKVFCIMSQQKKFLSSCRPVVTQNTTGSKRFEDISTG